jgi:hypothetical protein
LRWENDIYVDAQIQTRKYWSVTELQRQCEKMLKENDNSTTHGSLSSSSSRSASLQTGRVEEIELVDEVSV